MVTRTLYIGFDESKSESEALTEAVDEFADAADRSGYTVTQVPDTVVIRNAEHTAMREYIVQVTGEWSNGNE